MGFKSSWGFASDILQVVASVTFLMITGQCVCLQHAAVTDEQQASLLETVWSCTRC